MVRILERLHFNLMSLNNIKIDNFVGFFCFISTVFILLTEHADILSMQAAKIGNFRAQQQQPEA